MTVYAATRAQPLQFETPKDPADSIAYAFDFSAELDSGETITNQTITAETGITAATPSVTGQVVSTVLSGGDAGKKYAIGCQIETATKTLNITGVVAVNDR